MKLIPSVIELHVTDRNNVQTSSASTGMLTNETVPERCLLAVSAARRSNDHQRPSEQSSRPAYCVHGWLEELKRRWCNYLCH